MKTFKFILVIALLSSVSGCNKWKKPSDVKFHVDMDYTSTLNNQLTFTSGNIILEYFDFDGDREKGDDVIFDQDFTAGLSIPFDVDASIPELEFMIPQGEYKRIDVGMRTFDDNNTVCISVEGVFEYSAGGTIPFRFEFTESEQFKIRAEDESGGNIVLDKDVMSPAKIILDPNHWFEVVPIAFFDNADIVDLSGTNTILINNGNNSSIYDLVIDRLSETSLIVFNY